MWANSFACDDCNIFPLVSLYCAVLTIYLMLISVGNRKCACSGNLHRHVIVYIDAKHFQKSHLCLRLIYLCISKRVAHLYDTG